MSKTLYMLFCSILILGCSGPGSPSTESAEGPATSNAQGPEAVARRIVAEHSGAAPADITIVSVEFIEFSDSSLGCPSPDMAYLQVITPGHKVVASTADNDGLLDVRLSGRNGFVCEPRAKSPPTR
jgi:hypothetical protein